MNADPASLTTFRIARITDITHFFFWGGRQAKSLTTSCGSLSCALYPTASDSPQSWTAATPVGRWVGYTHNVAAAAAVTPIVGTPLRVRRHCSCSNRLPLCSVRKGRVCAHLSRASVCCGCARAMRCDAMRCDARTGTGLDLPFLCGGVDSGGYGLVWQQEDNPGALRYIQVGWGGARWDGVVRGGMGQGEVQPSEVR
jgi:hypothetical protein